MKLQDAIREFSDWRKFKVNGKTVVRYDRVLKIFCLCLNNMEVEDITLERVMDYLKSMESLGWQRNGIIITCLALRKFFEFLNMKGNKVISEMLIPLPRKIFKIPRIATEEGFRKLVKAIEDKKRPHNIRNLALLGLLWDSGARAGELVSLNVVDLNLIERHALIRTEKSRGRRPIREIFWTEKTNNLIKQWIKKKEHLQNLFHFHDPEALFISISKCAKYDSRGKRMTPNGVAEVMRMLSNKAGIPVVNAHSLRHHFGRDIIEKGGSNSDVSNFLGHSSVESSYIYTMMSGKQLQKRYDHFKRDQ